jgi:hypothetical protein
VVADEGERITVYGVNENPSVYSGNLRYGLFGLEGGLPMDKTIGVKLPANSSTRLAEIKRSDWERIGTDKSGAFAVLTGKDGVAARHRLFVTPFKDLRFARPDISISRGDGRIELVSPVFVWGVCIDIDGEAEVGDNCFDLLPGIPHTIPWSDSGKLPEVKMTGNDLVLKYR